MSTDDTQAATWLADHPKMTGILFTALLLLSQASTVAANGTASFGP